MSEAAVRHRWGTSTIVLDDQGDRVVIDPAPDDPVAAAEGALAAELGAIDVARLRRAARADDVAAELGAIDVARLRRAARADDLAADERRAR